MIIMVISYVGNGIRNKPGPKIDEILQEAPQFLKGKIMERTMERITNRILTKYYFLQISEYKSSPYDS